MRWLTFLLTVSFSLPALANEAAEWLREMSSSLMNSNYRGTFVYEMGEHMEAMRITHAIREDGEYERLLTLTGHPREVIRSPKGVTCILPKRKEVMMDYGLPRAPVPEAFSNNLDKIQQHYLLAILGEDRVSGYASRVIGVTPLDKYRYGYKLWMTESDKLPVRLELLRPDGTVLEKMMFTDLTVVDDFPEDWLKAELKGRHYDRKGKSAADMPVAEETATRWEVTWLPDGFERTHHNMNAMPGKGAPVEHLVYSDGLATVSVYVEGLDADKPRLHGLKTMGATHAMGKQIDSYQITVVGEVPATTIEKIATSVRYRP
jgi:sigma-E factor negative regulatory protein RseB